MPNVLAMARQTPPGKVPLWQDYGFEMTARALRLLEGRQRIRESSSDSSALGTIAPSRLGPIQGLIGRFNQIQRTRQSMPALHACRAYAHSDMAELAGLMGNAESSYALQQLLGNAHGPPARYWEE
jgi:hypothetical protein